ncbi:CHAT domain-containing protein [Candidatus Parabeggiatoa sp. HSG14]|uniref:CHAT domain-containing protein n=1 Tax=Candidatus Parabeggiatoa sp. HSG14 TaxID=3055593 RepID=UPI0025A71336|nr:CHAT domain-containing protein [Thiotrichales bacterium HSG14]
MSTIEELVEEIITNFFKKPLPKAQHALAAKIIKEIFFDAEDLSFTEWQQRVEQQEQDFSNIPEGRFAYLFLQKIAGESAETHFAKEDIPYYKKGIKQAKIWLAEGDTSVREVTLLLYDRLGTSQGKLGQVEEKIEIYKQGLTHAQAWLDDASVWKQVLNLYVNLGVSQGQLGQVEENIKTHQQGLTHAQAWLDDASVWALALHLYVNLGVSQGQLGQFEQAIEISQQGLTHAQAWLDDASVWESVLRLYDNLAVALFNSGHIAARLPYFPVINYFLWQVDSQNKQIIVKNQKNHFDYLTSPINFTHYFQDFLHPLITQWHNPNKQHRHPLISTHRLLRLSEGFYLINALQQRHSLHYAYLRLVDLSGLESQWQQQIGQPFAACLETAIAPWQELFPNTDFPLHAEFLNGSHAFQLEQLLDNVPWYKRLWYKTPVNILYQVVTQSRELIDKDNAFKIQKQQPWNRMLTETSEALIEWLNFGILQHLPLPTGLADRTSILLGIVFVYGKADPLDNRWISDEKFITDAIKKSQILDWMTGSEKKCLNSWWNHAKSSMVTLQDKLFITILDKEQETEQWQNTENLITDLKLACATIQPFIEPLARLFTALEQTDLTTPIEIILKQGYIKPACHERAITSLICGISQRELVKAISQWLEKPGNTRCFDVSKAIARNKQNFERISHIYPHTWQQTNWDEQVNGWTQVLLQEYLAANEITKLWTLLERSRIAFTSTTSSLNFEYWAEKTGTDLKKAFEEELNFLEQHTTPKPGTPWQPLEIWLHAIEELLPIPPTIAECQAQLTDSALVQLFFDSQDNLLALWLDAHNEIELRTLPKFTLDMSRWHNAIETLGKKGEQITNQLVEDMEATMAELKPYAKILSEWATGLTQITVIFPAPLAQLPWETLPELENILVRDISVATWLRFTKAGNSQSEKPWLVCDPSAAPQCTVKESTWLAKRFNTEIEHPSRFEAIGKFSNAHRIHLTTHGIYDPTDPTASRLSLNAEQGIELPLWMLNVIGTNADLIVLSACESNLTGESTTGILKSVGIGPNLIAAGAKTVVGTLWAYNGLAALCFSYHFYQIAKAEENLPWHIIATKARHAVRNMSHEALENLIAAFNLEDENDPCWTEWVESFYSDSKVRHNIEKDYKPFDRFDLWAGFMVLGQSLNRIKRIKG